MTRIVIIGGVAAGAKAAAKSRRLLPDAEIEIYTQDTHVSYSACGLPYYIEGNFEDYRMLLVRSPEEFAKDRIYVHLQNKVTKILPDSKKILVEDMQNKDAKLVDYDKLVIATGASPRIPDIKNLPLKNVFTLRTIEDGIAIKEKALLSRHATIIGSGYIGVELLEAFVKQNLKVTLVEQSTHFMPAFDNDISDLILEQLNSISAERFKIITGDIVTEFSGDEKGVKTVRLAGGDEFETDMVVVCAGVTPNIDIAKDAGIEIGQTGAIFVNKEMRTSNHDIYACGDCAEKTSLIDGSKLWIPLGSTANKEGRVAAMNLCGQNESFEGILGSAVTRCLGFTMSMTGYTEKKAQINGFSPISATVSKNDKVGYMPDVNNITLKIVADTKSGRILGGQAIGSGDADKRINTLTGAIIAKLTVSEFVCNDLTYAPPFSTTIDPLLNAAQILNAKLEKINNS